MDTIQFRRLITISLLGGFFTSTAHAAYVESAIGNAVVNDATAAYYNPAALTIVPNKQIVGIGVLASVLQLFNGSSRQIAPVNTGYTEIGGTSSRTHYTIPQGYISWPINNRITAGFGFLYTFYGIVNYPSNAVVRYSQTYNFFSSFDLVPAVGIKLNDKLSAGVGADLEFANIQLDAESGFPSLGIRDVKSSNRGSGTGWGAHAGLLWTPRLGTILGLVYHSAVGYSLRGSSNYGTVPPVHNTSFSLGVVTPSSWVFTINQFLSRKFNILGTIQKMNWSSVRNLNLQNVAFKFGGAPAQTLPSVVIPYFLHDSWRYTVASNYMVTDRWAVRGTASYDGDPTNPNAGLATGTNVILGVGTGYTFSKFFTGDLMYAHVFYKPVNINSSGGSNIITGTTQGGRDYLVGKVTFNL